MIDVANELTRLVESRAVRLRALEEELARAKPDPVKWSIQEIIGHLIDSATNNHQRFVRAQEGDVLVFPKYEQDDWVSVQGYNEGSWEELVELWRLYNRHLAQVMARTPPGKLSVECRIGPGEPVSLQFLLEDYVVHLRHHLDQIEAKIAV